MEEQGVKFIMAMRDKIEHAIQNQPCTVRDLKSKFGGDRGSDRKFMEAVDQLVHDAVICQRQGVFFTVRSGRADKALPGQLSLFGDEVVGAAKPLLAQKPQPALVLA